MSAPALINSTTSAPSLRLGDNSFKCSSVVSSATGTPAPGTGASGLTDADVALFQRVFANGIPLYFIGDRLAAATANLSASVRPQWTSLLRLTPATTKLNAGTVNLVDTERGGRVALGSTGADGWAFSAAPLVGSTVGPAVTTRTGSGGSAAITWNGRTNGGTVVADGLYRLTMSAADHAGNRASRSWTVRVDRTPAAIQATVAPATFSPNGDGAADLTRLAWSSSERISGLARIVRGTTVIRSWTVTGASAGAIAWNGTNASGSVVPDGTYAFRVAGRDAAGNLAVRSASIVVDRTLSTVRWSRSAFYPQDGDAIAPNARLSFSLKRTAAVSVGIYSGSTLVRTIWTDRSLAAGPHGWTWDGRDALGALVPRGAYIARVTTRSWVGTSVVSRAILVDAFAVALSATAVRAGQTLTVTVTTTEALRAAPVVTFTQPGRTAVARTATALGAGRYRVTFTIATGSAGMATIRITGRDTAGGLNTSVRSVTIR